MNDRKNTLSNPKVQTVLVILAALLFYLYLTARADQLPTFLDFLRFAFYTATFRFSRIPASIQSLILDGVLFFSGLLLWMAFYAQFILPVRTIQDRYAALDRLVVYFMGAHGPAIFVENGEVRMRRQEAERRGPGLIYLDSASAAVLRNDVSFTRPVGQGVVFTPKHEYLASAVDLHIQAQPRPPLGPLPGEDPFAPRALDETEELYALRKERRLQTSAITRDGVELVPNIMAVYQIERLPKDTSLGFSFNPDAVLRYVTTDGVSRAASHGVSPEGGKGQVPLHLLPAHLAVDLWREYIQKFTLNELFSTPTGKVDWGLLGSDTALQIIRRMVQQRLTLPLVEELNGAGQPTGRTVRSREYEVLKGAGIQVLSASISNLRLLKSVEQTMVHQWYATWTQRAQMDRDAAEQRRSRAALFGREEALLRFSQAAIRRFDEDLLSLPKPAEPEDEFAQMKMALEKLVHGTLVDTVSDTALYQRLASETNYLSELIDWIRGQHP
jgi:hypothetical protein